MRELYIILYDYSTYNSNEPFYHWEEYAFFYETEEMTDDMSLRLILKL